MFNQPYGRFFYLARSLSTLGHVVEMVLFSYNSGENETRTMDAVVMHSISVLPFPMRAWKRCTKLADKFEPDWVFGFSDTYFGILAVRLARHFQSKSLIDAYDNYEAYLPIAKPVHWLWRKSIKQADLVTCAGQSIKELLQQHRLDNDVFIIPMSTDPHIKKKDKYECRKRLGLDADTKILGYHGSITNSRNIQALFDAYRIIKETKENIELVLCGRLDKSMSLPADVKYLGYLEDEQVNDFINSMDMILVMNQLSSFGKYSHPVKLYEAMKCEKPVLASRTPSTEWILSKHPELLIDTRQNNNLSEKILSGISKNEIKYGVHPDWSELAASLNEKLY